MNKAERRRLGAMGKRVHHEPDADRDFFRRFLNRRYRSRRIYEGERAPRMRKPQQGFSVVSSSQSSQHSRCNHTTDRWHAQARAVACRLSPFSAFDPSKRPNPHGRETSWRFFHRSGRPSRTLRKSRVVPGSWALGRLDASKVTGAVGGPRLLEIDPAVALSVRQPGRMHGERDDVEGR